MNLKKTSVKTIALLCIAQVGLLLLASVSPQIHTWAFHGKHAEHKTCSGVHNTCSKLPDSSDEHNSPRTTPENSDGLCPVTLFDEGVNHTDEPALQLIAQSPLLGLIAIRSDTIWTSYSEAKERARAPPSFR